MNAATAAERNLAAETRAVEAGHRALVVDGGAVEVVSDTHGGGPDSKRYRVEFVTIAEGHILFDCQPSKGRKLYTDDHRRIVSPERGVVCCQHAALAARSLERRGLAKLVEGRWTATAAKHVHDFAGGDCSCGEPLDPFSGLS